MLRRRHYNLRCNLARLLSLSMFLAVILCSSFSFAEESKKTILLLSSRGGGGHLAASNTLQKLVGEEYDIKVVFPIDQLRIWGVPSGEQIYNKMLRKGWIRTTNFITRHIAPTLFGSREDKMEQIVGSYADVYQPHLIISLIPFVNYPASEAARKREVPYLLITTDNDLRNWVYGLEKLKHPHFKVTIGADLPMTRELLRRKNIPEAAIETVGLPLRLEFIKPTKDPEQIKSEFSIPLDKPTILVMMGGAGSDSCYDYAKRIGQLNINAHLIVILGRNEKLRKSIERIRMHPSNSITILGFTDRVADLMSISDVIITKPGPGTINEALAMHLPVLIDNTEISLFWERVNVDMVLQYGVGDRIRDPKQLKKMLKNYLKDARTRSHVAESYVSVPQNLFHERIPKIILEMFQEPSSQTALAHPKIDQDLSLNQVPGLSAPSRGTAL